MSTFAPYDALYLLKDIHKIIVDFGDELDEEQLRWRPRGYSTSIGFHLWHLARESDFFKAVVLERTPQLVPEFGEPVEIWAKDNLARRWGFPTDLGATVGTGLSDEVASTLPIPPKDELMQYLKLSYGNLEDFIHVLDQRFPTFNGLEEDLKKKLENIRLNLLVFISHDCRHLGMMEVLKGLQTGFGSATEKRK